MRRDEYGRPGVAVWVGDHAILAVCMVVLAWLAAVAAVANAVDGLL